MSTSAEQRLIIMRHAKTEQAAQTDHARRLTDRGQNDARSAGEWLAAAGHRPQLILASSAARAEETAEIVATATGARRVEMLDGLYGADAYETIDLVSDALGDDVRIAMVVGHNPMIEELASVLQGAGADGLRFRTSAIAVLDCGGEPWHDLDQGHARLLASHCPRD